MDKSELPITNWRKSINSLEGNCVEVGFATDGTVGVRDSKNRDAGELRFTASEWAAFRTGMNNGEFDN